MGIKIDRFFDIETMSWDTYVLGGVVTAGTRSYFSSRDPLELFYNLVDTGGDVWAWNGGLYDFLWFADVARDRGYYVELGCAGPRIVRLQCEKLVLRDAIAVIPMSLAKGASIIGETLDKDTGLPCICGTDCGGYCSINLDMSPEHWESLDYYLKKDCTTGLDIVEAVIEEADRSEYILTGTVGGSSYKTAQTHLNLEPAVWNGSHYRLARKAYFGGRTEVFQPIAREGFAYDINSAYPAALTETKLPTGFVRELEESDARKAYAYGKEGIFMASVRVPEDMFIPPLPQRVGDRVCFAVGPLEGIWTALELREAERLGSVVEILGGLVWSDSEAVLAPFMEHVWARRDANRGNKGLYVWHKFIANSLTGKLAEKPDKERVMIHPDPAKLVACPGGKCGRRCTDENARSCQRKTCCDRVCRKTCGRWECIDDKNSIYTSPFYKISECGHVHWAAYLTASARIKLARQLRADGQGGKTAVYCDTDSVYATAERTENIGPALGQWGFDGEIAEWFALAPKMYRYKSEEGKQVIRAKGLSGINLEDFERFCAGESVVRDRGVKSFKSAARSSGVDDGLFVRKYLSRSSHADGIHYGSRRLADDGKTYPMTIQQILEAEERRK